MNPVGAFMLPFYGFVGIHWAPWPDYYNSNNSSKLGYYFFMNFLFPFDSLDYY